MCSGDACSWCCSTWPSACSTRSLVWFGWGALLPRFPTPYAVPIFDVPFALVAVGIGYLCLERHRLRQDARSAAWAPRCG